MEHVITDVARLAGVTSRTLRHYDAVGLLAPTRIGADGVRWYDEDALVRLQRILLLRELGLALPAIAEVLDRRVDESVALRTHRDLLRDERGRIDRQITALETTMAARRRKEPLMAAQMFDGFDHTAHREEVETRWGTDAYAASDAWWRQLSEADRTEWQERAAVLASDWRAAAERGVDPASAEAAALVTRQRDWLRGVPGTPAGAEFDDYVRGLGDMYVADPRFAATYGGVIGAAFVRDALHRHIRPA